MKLHAYKYVDKYILIYICCGENSQFFLLFFFFIDCCEVVGRLCCSLKELTIGPSAGTCSPAC